MSILIRPPEKSAEEVFIKLLAHEMKDTFMMDLFQALQYPDMKASKGKGKKEEDEDAKAQTPDKNFPAEFYHILSHGVGRRLIIPRKNTIDSLISKAEMYVFIRDQKNPDEAYRAAMARYKLSRGDIDRIFRMVRSIAEK